MRLLLAALLLALSVTAAADGRAPPARLVQHVVHPSDFARAREALQDAIENQGLIVGSVSHFGEMLARTAPALGHAAPVYGEAEILSFCSATASWAMVEENPALIAFCPLTIALYTLPGDPTRVHFVYRDPGTDSAGLRGARELLRTIAEAAVRQSRRVLSD